VIAATLWRFTPIDPREFASRVLNLRPTPNHLQITRVRWPRTIAQSIRDTLTANRWRINYFGPTTYMANVSAFTPQLNDLPQQLRAKFSPETLEQMSGINNRFVTIVNLIDGDRVYLPFTVAHAERVD
jgi:hypothetical protein